MSQPRAVAPRPSVVLAHDYLTEAGGAERVISAIAAHHPDAPLLTSAVRRDTLDQVLARRAIRASRLDILLADKRRAKALFPLVPLAFATMHVPPSDVLLTSSSGFAHHLRPAPGQFHAWYCHTPPRFVWDPDAYFGDQRWLATAMGPVLGLLRRADRRAAARVDLIIANSAHTAAKVKRTYGRTAPVLWPPVPVDDFRPSTERSDRLLVVARLLSYKRIDVAIGAAAMAGVGLDIVGDGPERTRLERMAGPGVRFLGRLPDAEVRARLARCTALLVPGTEDLGIAAVEAQASGRPPIVLAAGGALETVEDGVSGYHVAVSEPAEFAAAIVRAASTPLPVPELVAAARRLDTPRFLSGLDALIAAALETPVVGVSGEDPVTQPGRA